MDPTTFWRVTAIFAILALLTTVPLFCVLLADLREEIGAKLFERRRRIEAEEAYADLFARHTELMDAHHETQRVLRAVEGGDTMNEVSL